LSIQPEHTPNEPHKDLYSFSGFTLSIALFDK